MIQVKIGAWKLSFVALAAVGMGLLAGCGDTAASNEPATTTTTGATGGTTASATRPESTGPGNETTGDKISIGLVASETGSLRPWGVDCVQGVKLAVDEVNKAGGIQGKMIDLKIGDSASEPQQGKNATQKLISDDKVLAIIGEVASGITKQMATPAFEKGVPIMAVGATAIDITDIGTNVFRVCYSDDIQGEVMALFAYDELKLKNVALMTDQKQPYSVGLSKSFKDKFIALGGTIVDEQTYESGQTNFTGQLTNLKAKKPDGLFCSGYFNEVGPIARQALEQGLTVKLMGGDGWDSRELLTTGGKGIIGGYFCNHYSDLDDRPQVKDFLTKWKAMYNTAAPATTMGALGYDAAMVVFDSLKRAKGLNSKALITAISETENFPAVSGDITLKGTTGTPKKRALVVQVEADGNRKAKSYEYDDVKGKK